MQRLQQAAAFLQRGDPARALAIAEAEARADPHHPEALHLLAMALSDSGDIERATAVFEAAAAIHPRKDVILVNLGEHLRRCGRLKEAIDVFERAMRAAPGSLGASLALGSARAALGDQAGAEDAYRKALAIEPKNSAALIGLGNLASARGEDDPAVAFYSQALSAAPQSSAALINRGAALRRLGRIEESLSDLLQATKSAPNLAAAHFQLAATLRTAARFDDAGEAYRAALSLAPARADIHREYTALMYEAGWPESAFDLLDKVIATKASAPLLLARGDLSLLFGDIDAAQIAARSALSIEPTNADVLGLASKAARKSGEISGAVHWARAALARSPNDLSLLHLCAETEIAAGLAAEAAQRLDRAVPIASLQKHIALKATAMRASGDPEYRRYFDYDRFTAQIDIDAPPGFPTIEAFNAALLDAIAPLHQTKQRPLSQTLFGGTQSPGRLWNVNNPIFKIFGDAMLAAARGFVAQLPDDTVHPFLGRKSQDLECVGAWSVMLTSGGGHVDHIHPAGWISASYYVASPPEIFSGDRSGHLRLGASGVPEVALPAERYHPPRAGSVVFFPSYIWHDVEPFEASGSRVTAPFDLAPAAEKTRTELTLQ